MSSGKNVPINIVIGAVDNATYKLIGINDKFKKFSAPFQKIGAAFKAFGEETGIGKLATSLGKVGKAGKEFGDDLLEATAKVAGVTIGAATAIFELVHGFSDAGENVARFSKRLGFGSDEFQEYAYAAKKANIPQEEFVQSMTKFSRGIAETGAGTGEAILGFNALGISVRDQNGKLKTSSQLFPQVVQGLSQVHNQSLRNAIAAKIFGREGANLNEIFEGGAAGLEKMRKEAHEVGAVMTPEQIKSAVQFDEGLKSITATLEGVRNTIGAALAPVVLGFLEKAQKWVLANHDQIMKWADAFADALPGAIQAVIDLFKGMWEAVQPLIAAVKALCDVFGTSNVVFAAMAVYIGGPLVASFVSLLAAILGCLGPIVNFAVIVGGVALDAVLALGAGLVALVGWPVLIGAAFVAAAVAIWKYWGPISDFFDNLWQKAKKFFPGGDVAFTNSQNAAMNTPSLGPAMGNPQQTVDASSNQNSTTSETHLKVDFMNAPKGTRVETNRSNVDQLDMNIGYAGVG